MKKININLMLIKGLGFKSLFLALPLFVISSCSSDEKQTVAQFTELVMQDEFTTDGAPNSTIWTYDLGTGNSDTGAGWGNNELQSYTNRTENVKVENGYLLITAKKESFNGASYTSARLTTKGLFEQAYGRFEARIRVPYGQGIWPAFWLLGANCDEVAWPQCGEIDIMEYRGQEPTTVLGSVHGPGYSGANAITKSYSLLNDRFDTGFHIFGIEWGPDYINYYVDDVLYNQITPSNVKGEWVFDHPFYIIINLAVGGNFVGAPNSETVFPQTMLVDYVRVYKK
ncbi:glycoside hydrolase family 16 protein [Flavobacterium caseinilyticum]|uniref:Glycoside hydrolase family 16 protein n=1 Tax=Flavobacterium caseinilyticum TaxID=2541732 RepID=A0A4R5AUM0_9FLAO|nr:glycoside hydrolase family 16 protein [Flavobacterium caseinilyticum]TDD75579.1 glycoside hydrolase family 16 protein [Flavobacterium caseinilyticum]